MTKTDMLGEICLHKNTWINDLTVLIWSTIFISKLIDIKNIVYTAGQESND